MDELAAFESFWRTQLLTISGLTTLVGSDSSAKIYNSIAPTAVATPYNIFTIVPLNDKTGQARSSILTRLLVDNKILTTFPVPSGVSAAIAAVKEHFRAATQASFDTAFAPPGPNYRISVRHERPISYIEPGGTAEDRILHRGGTFAVWMHKL